MPRMNEATKVTGLAIPLEIVEDIDKIAALDRRSRSNMVIVLLEEALKARRSAPRR